MKREEIAFWLDSKALMEHAIFHQQNGSKMDMRLAVNHAHQAIELTLRRKVELLGKNPWDFPKILKTLREEGVKIPYGRQIEELNKIRILTQHYGTTPNENDACRLIFVARDFLIDFWKDAFGVSYSDISLTDLISDDGVRKVLKEAEDAENYDECVTKSVLATFMVKWWIEAGFYEEGPFTSGISLVDSVDFNVSDALNFILDVALSSPFAYKLRKLRKETGIVFLPIPGGTPKMQKLKQQEFTRQDALQAMELAIEYALWAEQIYG